MFHLNRRQIAEQTLISDFRFLPLECIIPIFFCLGKETGVKQEERRCGTCRDAEHAFPVSPPFIPILSRARRSLRSRFTE